MFDQAQTSGNARRAKYARDHGMDVMYAEDRCSRYETWAYSDGDRVPMRPFYTLEGLQGYAQKHHYAVIYVA